MRRYILWLLITGLLVVAGCSSQSGGDVLDPDLTDFPSSGIPDQNSLSISVDKYNPRARNIDGTAVTITVRLADQLGHNSTILDGTEVFFATGTDGGSIESSCRTNNGACSVTWTSQDPRPDAGPAIVDPLGSGENVVSHSSGRSTVLVWTNGIESFIDENSNGLFDDSDTQIDDVGDPFLDKDEDGVHDNGPLPASVPEEFVDFPIPSLGVGGTYDTADGLYSGPNCAHTTDCAVGQNANELFIFENIEIAMSSDSICIVPVDDAGTYWDSNVTFTEPVNLKTDRSSFSFLVHDCYGNPPMSGTTIEFESAVGADIIDDGGTVPNTSVDMGTTDTGGTRARYPTNSLVYSAVVFEELDNDEGEAGLLKITVTNDVASVTYALQLLDPMN
ncbi:MAG TPA: hypothetical protein VGL10_01725 [Gammaproteobacteria bacterium]